MSVKSLRRTVQGLLPSLTPVRFVAAEDGTPVARPSADYTEPPAEALREALLEARLKAWLKAWRRMAWAAGSTLRRPLSPNGPPRGLASSRGQEACQIGCAVLALRPDDWLFRTYRVSVALVTRDIDPAEVLTLLLRGDWHCGYDPAATRAAPGAPPLAPQALYANGMAEPPSRKGRDGVAVALVGIGATSEGGFVPLPGRPRRPPSRARASATGAHAE
jgi:pyruvate dehydrogenase E1 component alpha subunit